MIKQSFQSVKETGLTLRSTGNISAPNLIAPISPNFKDPENNFKHFDHQNTQSQNKKIPDHKESSINNSEFTIHKNFSDSSKQLAKTLGKFEKILSFLEKEPQPSLSNQPSLPKQRRHKTSSLKVLQSQKKPRADFSMHETMTNEIIRAISHAATQLTFITVNEKIARTVANHLQKQLEKQSFAIATNQNSAPLTVLEK